MTCQGATPALASTWRGGHPSHCQTSGRLLVLPPTRPRGRLCLGPTSSASWALVSRVSGGWGTAGGEALKMVGTWQLPQERKDFPAAEPPADKLPRVDPRISSRILPANRTTTHRSEPSQAAPGLLGESKPVSSQWAVTGSLALPRPQPWARCRSQAAGQVPGSCRGHSRAREQHTHPSDKRGRMRPQPPASSPGFEEE